MNAEPLVAPGYTSCDLKRLREKARGEPRSAEEIGGIVDAYGYQTDWQTRYKIRSVRESLYSDRITCVDAAVLSYGLLELLFPKTKRKLLAIHRRDKHGEECGHCVTLYWSEDGRVGAFSKSAFDGFGHRPAVYVDEHAIALSFAQSYAALHYVPLYYGMAALEEVAEDLDWRFAEGDLNELSERLISRYQYGFEII